MEVIRETGYGVWVWQCSDGEILGEDGNYMLVFGTDHDQAAKKAITDAARHHGYPDGKAVFWPDVRPVTDEEYDNQLSRSEAGLTPDIWDLGAIKEEMKAIHEGR